MASTSRVHLTADAYMVCLAHSLSTEKEEIMGLLIGEHSFVDQLRICHISAVIMLRRSDKQPDRVEISPEQLSAASTHAETLAAELQRPMRVVGWYHSHPRITVWPSHVDVRTQAMYQLMDEGFVGLIFSVFNNDKSSQQNRMQLTCFQSINTSPEGEPPQLMRLEVAVHVVPTAHIAPHNLKALVQLPCILSQEEEEAYEKTSVCLNLDTLTRIHNGSVFTKCVCQIMELISGPLMQTLENRLKHNQDKIRYLNETKTTLEEDLKKMNSIHQTGS